VVEPLQLAGIHWTSKDSRHKMLWLVFAANLCLQGADSELAVQHPVPVRKLELVVAPVVDHQLLSSQVRVRKVAPDSALFQWIL
jgi:hypothetical protein